MKFVSIQRRGTAIVFLLGIFTCATVLCEKCDLHYTSQFITILSNNFPFTALALPPICMARSCSHVQLVSNCVERIKVKCTPSERCIAEQSMHKNTPYVTDAHVGFCWLQSKHC